MMDTYVAPEIMELEIQPGGAVLSASTYMLNDYQSNGDAIELEF